MDDRAKHLKWCKERALAYVRADDNEQAFASFASDMSKHSKTADPALMVLGMGLRMSGHLDTSKQMEDWINGHN